MFSKIDKKILTITIAVFVVILLIGIFAFKSLDIANPEVENSLGGVQAESNLNQDQQQSELQAGIEIEAEAEGENSGGTLTMCLDECGNGICQVTDTDCIKNNTNCVCAENSQECPQDCK
jgi:hypothetical protein